MTVQINQTLPDQENSPAEHFQRTPVVNTRSQTNADSHPRSNRPRGTSERWEGASTLPREQVKELHSLDHSPFKQFAMHFVGIAIASSISLVAWNAGYPLVSFALWFVAGFLGHALPLASHDASHGTLHPSKRINELLGLAIGTLIIVPRSVYRYAHAQHHTHIATEKDPELWPFTIKSTPRWLRLFVAAIEVVLGFLYTPVLFLRSVLVADNVPADQVKLIRREYALIGFFWGSVLGAVTYMGWWHSFMIGAVGPWMVAGWMQSLNKYVEHMGMMGVGVTGNTRSVVPEDEIGMTLAEAWQNVAYHATHHLYAKIPYYKLPDASQHVIAGNPPPGTLYTNYPAALFAMLKTLGNPRVGAHWLKSE